MNTATYFSHARSLGAFTAQDCLAIARQAAELDRAAELRKVPQPVVVWHESLPDGSGTARFSNGITVY
jgi:hypothetical protein